MEEMKWGRDQVERVAALEWVVSCRLHKSQVWRRNGHFGGGGSTKAPRLPAPESRPSHAGLHGPCGGWAQGVALGEDFTAAEAPVATDQRLSAAPDAGNVSVLLRVILQRTL